jgi:hypothetical protein
VFTEFRNPVLVILGLQRDIALFLKEMRTRHVDINAKGQPCKERLLREVIRRPVAFEAFEPAVHAMLEVECGRLSRFLSDLGCTDVAIFSSLDPFPKK